MVLLGRCPSCGASGRLPWLRHYKLKLWLCNGCGVGYSDPQPREAVEQRYLSQYDLAEHFGALENRKSVLTERRLDRLPDLMLGNRLLDVGCGDGQFAASAQSRGWRSHGVELNPSGAARARARGVDVVEGHLEGTELPDASFDLVTAWDVIEHVPDPRPFIEHLVRLVAPGGLIVITTLNRRALVARAFRGRWSMLVEDHFTYWDRRSLRRAFAATGVRLVSTTSFGLGRDFVTWIDRWRGGASHRASVAACDCRPAARRGSGWDSGTAVLSAERALNRFLDATSLGVGIEMVFRPTEEDHARQALREPLSLGSVNRTSLRVDQGESP